MKGSMFATVGLTLGLVACSGIKVTTDYNPETDLTQYESCAVSLNRKEPIGSISVS